MKSAMQGKDGTFYVGEVMSFGDMEEAVEYKQNLIRSFLRRPNNAKTK